MKTAAILLATLGSASAFAPSKSVSHTSLNAIADLVGGEGPEPIPFSPSGTSVDFDPLGLATVSNPRFFSLFFPHGILFYLKLYFCMKHY